MELFSKILKYFNPIEKDIGNSSNNCIVCNENDSTKNRNTIYAYMHSDCPLNRRELGRASWAYLHTLANFYSESPTKLEKKEMAQLLFLYIKHYPCGYCSDMSLQEMYRNPPRVNNRKELSFWMCELHNEVNHRMGKPAFDCSTAQHRWRYGYIDNDGKNKCFQQ